MKISHLAILTSDLEGLRNFYCTYFMAKSNKMYVNPKKQFSSYFLTFENGDCSIELMNKPTYVSNIDREKRDKSGLAHFAISVGSKKAVDELTEQLRASGIEIIGEPRQTGDGFYESVIADPDGNIVEITI